MTKRPTAGGIVQTVHWSQGKHLSALHPTTAVACDPDGLKPAWPVHDQQDGSRVTVQTWEVYWSCWEAVCTLRLTNCLFLVARETHFVAVSQCCCGVTCSLTTMTFLCVFKKGIKKLIQ